MKTGVQMDFKDTYKLCVNIIYKSSITVVLAFGVLC
jgi:hypothetical protein